MLCFKLLVLLNPISDILQLIFVVYSASLLSCAIITWSSTLFYLITPFDLVLCLFLMNLIMI